MVLPDEGVDDDIIELGGSIWLIWQEDHMHEALECCWSTVEVKGEVKGSTASVPRLHWMPSWVRKSWGRGTCQYPSIRSMVDMNWALPTQGMGYPLNTEASLSIQKLLRSWRLLSSLGTTTVGQEQGFMDFSIAPSWSISVRLASIVWQRASGSELGHCLMTTPEGVLIWCWMRCVCLGSLEKTSVNRASNFQSSWCWARVKYGPLCSCSAGPAREKPEAARAEAGSIYCIFFNRLTW